MSASEPINGTSKLMHHVRNGAAVVTFPLTLVIGWIISDISENRDIATQNAKDIAIILRVMDERSRALSERSALRDDNLRRELATIRADLQEIKDRAFQKGK